MAMALALFGGLVSLHGSGSTAVHQSMSVSLITLLATQAENF